MVHILVTGIRDPEHPDVTPVYPRLEWSTFYQDKEFLTLYVKALEKFKAMSTNDTMSFYQLAGIHGLPLHAWDEPAGTKPPTSIYCAHAKNIFPTWHRPYLALYEQALAAQFDSILAEYQHAPIYADLKEKSKTWRLPYWDWGVHPEFFNEWLGSSINIYGTDGKLAPYANPFVSYAFTFTPAGFSGNYAKWKNTLRWPTSTQPNATSDPTAGNPWMKNEGFPQKIMSLFPTVLPDPKNPWTRFATKAYPPPPGTGPVTSLESIHDSVHVYIGGFPTPGSGHPAAGHMTNTACSAFDPLFWLHHCQIDRLTALWMACYPGIYVPNNKTMDSLHAPMAPFWNSQTANVQSADCSVIQTYGYTYPEILKYPNDTPSQLAKDVYAEVEALYQTVRVAKLFATPSVATETVAKIDSALSEGQPQKVRLVVQNKAVHLTSAAKPPSNPGHDDYVVTPDTYREWIVNISLDAHALGGSGIIALFLGPSEEVPKTAEEWVKSPLYVGSYAVFTTQEEDMDHCDNCKDQQNEGVKIAGTVHLTECLIHNRVNLTGSEPEKYLKENLRWRCSGPNGVIPNTDIPSLEIAVESAAYVPSVGVIDGRPEQGPWTRHGGVTYGRPGGSQTAAA